jgi:hypothetical protein
VLSHDLINAIMALKISCHKVSVLCLDLIELFRMLLNLEFDFI